MRTSSHCGPSAITSGHRPWARSRSARGLRDPARPTAGARLRAQHRAAYLTWRRDLALDGCAAMGYRLSGSLDLATLCVRHLVGRWRTVVAFRGEPPDDEAHVVLVAEHDGSPANVYALLYGLLGQEPEPGSGRSKPSCCGDDDAPPATEDALVELLSRRVRSVSGR